MLKMNDVHKKISESTFVFFDVETTGLSPWSGDRICEVAFLTWEKGTVLGTFQSLVNPGRPISKPASAVNGITDQMVEHAPCFADLVPEIRRLLKSVILVGHNAVFDLSFLEFQLQALQEEEINNTVIDTLSLARRCYTFSSNNLGAIARSLHAPMTQEHRALGDALLTKEIFERFLRDFDSRNIQQIGELIELQGGEISVPQRPAVVVPTMIAEMVREKKPLAITYVTEFGEEVTVLARLQTIKIVDEKVVMMVYFTQRQNLGEIPVAQIKKISCLESREEEVKP